MGVRGLTTFINFNSRSFYKQERIRDCDLVIDGYALVYELYFNECKNGKLNGEFLGLAENVDLFFSNLAECNITPYVIFDGPIEANKLPCVIDRLQERVKDVHSMIYKKSFHGRVLPLFAVDVLLHYIVTHDIKFAVTLVDADCEIVAVANHLRCPVLSQDSDYYIYNIRMGYIPFSHFDWKQVWTRNQSKVRTIDCKKYEINTMYEQYGVNVTLLPFLSVLLGNDWIEPGVFAGMVSSLPLARSNRHVKVKRRKDTSKIDSVITWLASKSGNATAIWRKMHTCLDRARQQHLKPKVDEALAIYQKTIPISETLQVLGITDHSGPEDNKLTTPSDAIQGLVRRSRAHPSVLNVIDSKYVCLPVVMSDSKKMSAHDSALEIRKFTYRVLVRKYRFPLAGAEFLYVQEYDKVGTNYMNSRLISIFSSLCPLCELHHSEDDLCPQGQSGGANTGGSNVSAMHLLKKICPKVSSFCRFVEAKKLDVFSGIDDRMKTYLDLVIASITLWNYKVSPDSVTLYALTVAIAYSYCLTIETMAPEISISSPRSTIDDQQPAIQSLRCKSSLAGNVRKQFLNLLFPPSETKSKNNEEFQADNDFLHDIAIWLCSLNATIILHQVVENPPTRFAIHHFLTSSKFLHKIHSRITDLRSGELLKGNSNVAKVLEEKLEPMPRIKSVFQCFTEFIASSQSSPVNS